MILYKYDKIKLNLLNFVYKSYCRTRSDNALTSLNKIKPHPSGCGFILLREKKLLNIDCSAGFGEFLLHLFSAFFRNAFLDGLGSGFNKILCVL